MKHAMLIPTLMTLICLLKNRRRTPIKMFTEIKVFLRNCTFLDKQLIVSGVMASLLHYLKLRI